MRKLSSTQRKQLAEILGNIAVAWFAGGIISPLFAHAVLGEAILYVLIGLLLTVFFSAVSVTLVGRKI